MSEYYILEEICPNCRASVRVKTGCLEPSIFAMMAKENYICPFCKCPSDFFMIQVTKKKEEDDEDIT